jgi:hypothetical protein
MMLMFAMVYSIEQEKSIDHRSMATRMMMRRRRTTRTRRRKGKQVRREK